LAQLTPPDATRRPVPWSLYFSEFAGTGLLLLIGLSLAILMFGAGSPIAAALPSEGARRAITGFLFGATGGFIALSRVGKESGAHINPAVTLAFWLLGKLDGRTSLGYVAAQIAGAAAGCLPLLAWGGMGRSVAFGATLPGEGYPLLTVVMGEAITTFALIAGLCVFLGFRHLRRFTPLLFPFLYGVIVWAEAPISGTSTNPARSLGPALISGRWQGWWIYWVGPLAGTLGAVLACSFLAKRIAVAKLYHFDSDPHRVFFKAVTRPEGS
jgi:aquaporin Z